MKLAELQRALQIDVLRGTRWAEPLIEANAQFDTIARLKVYQHAFVARLTEALATTYPALKYALRERRFGDLVRAYADGKPPSHFSIRYYGDDLATFISSVYTGNKGAVLSELARWEWLLSEAFDAADAQPITRETLLEIPAAQWCDVRFEVSPSLRRLAFSTNALQWWHAAKTEHHGSSPKAWRRAKPNEWIIWRTNLKTCFRSLTSAEVHVLNHLTAGSPFATICEELARHCESDASERAAKLLNQWVNDGWIVAAR